MALRSRGGWLIDVVGHGVVVADLAWVTDHLGMIVSGRLVRLIVDIGRSVGNIYIYIYI